METLRIAELLAPFLKTELSLPQLTQISTYIDLLLRWNARTNLTAIRDLDSIVTRHFGESLFAAQFLFPRIPPGAGSHASTSSAVASMVAASTADSADRSAPPSFDGAAGVPARRPPPETLDLLDIGSGAGFPGLPIKLWAPQLRTILLESQNKKVAFLREVIRALTLTDINISALRAEHFAAQANLVTLRAVERFDSILPIAARRVAAHGRLVLLIGEGQIAQAQTLASDFHWHAPTEIPQSRTRILLVGDHHL